MWDRTRDSLPMGHRRYWAIVDALEASGLAGTLDGVKSPGANQDGKGQLSAVAWPSDALVGLGASHGVTAETRKQDWRTDATLRAIPANYSDAVLVSCKPAETWGAVQAPFSPDVEADLARFRRDVLAINHLNGAADIRGAGHTTALVRPFRHSLAFGGRFYSPVCSMSPEDRQRITINGSPVAEVDLKASQLTLLLGSLATVRPPMTHTTSAASRGT